MTSPEVVRFGDGHYRRVIYGLGPYIADYEEQVLLACIVRNWCPKCVFIYTSNQFLHVIANVILQMCGKSRQSWWRRITSYSWIYGNTYRRGSPRWSVGGLRNSCPTRGTFSMFLLVPFILLIMSRQPFTNDFPRADIHQMLSPDILHQLIKGAFKDHLMTWVEKYLRHTHSKRTADKIMDDIDRR